MRKLLWFGITVLWLGCWAAPAGAQVNVEVVVPLPPPLFFPAPPQVVVLPDTYIYVVPDVSEDIYFFDGWWWRPWGGHWYRSHYYDQGWGYYSSVPGFYFEVHQNWRHEYKSHHWNGQPWNYEHVSHHQVQENWSSWKKNKHWEKQKNRGVQGVKPRPQPQAHVNAQQPRAMQQPGARQPKAQTQRPQAQQPRAQAQQTDRTRVHARPSQQGHRIQGQPSGGQQQQQKGKGKKKGGKGRRGR